MRAFFLIRDRVRIGFLLHFGRFPAAGSVAQIGFVELQTELGDALVLRCDDVCDNFVLIDHQKIPAAQSRAIVPCAVDPFLTAAAMDRVDDDPLREGFLGCGAGIDPTLGERLVAGDEDRFVGFPVIVPSEIAEGALDHRTAVFLSTIGFEGEKLRAEIIEIAGQRTDQADPIVSDGIAVIAVFVKRDLDERCLAIALRIDEGVDDFPKLRFRLIDQAVHAVGRI